MTVQFNHSNYGSLQSREATLNNHSQTCINIVPDKGSVSYLLPITPYPLPPSLWHMPLACFLHPWASKKHCPASGSFVPADSPSSTCPGHSCIAIVSAQMSLDQKCCPGYLTWTAYFPYTWYVLAPLSSFVLFPHTFYHHLIIVMDPFSIACLAHSNVS